MENRSEKIENSLVYLIRVFQIMRDRACKFGVRSPLMDPSYVILSFLIKEELPISEIGKRLQRSKPNMTAIINRLIKEGTVQKLTDKNDRRITRVIITQKGREYIENRKRTVRKSVRENLETLSNEDLDILHKSLENVNRIASKINGD
ncbi:MarR family protein [Candidatus Bilamarchaeum dharawalense]|uniref:MarR family protein n=1 Tax=Candidatus Bilamarchaeum dharawalense TaxID=2885759 RepID=A0A5E4LL65_9ARCH|nr:MarR family protein [Candidatus Bilamarchaeum dharawalense]